MRLLPGHDSHFPLFGYQVAGWTFCSRWVDDGRLFPVAGRGKNWRVNSDKPHHKCPAQDGPKAPAQGHQEVPMAQVISSDGSSGSTLKSKGHIWNGPELKKNPSMATDTKDSEWTAGPTAAGPN